MRLSKILITLLGSALAPHVASMPTDADSARLEARQGRNSGPGKFCEKASPAPPDDEVRARHEKFADAFLVKKDVRLAFEYIAPEYINHNPMAQNGAQWALNLLSGFWPSQRITVRRTLYRNNTSWLNYDGSAGSNIIDRYRWEGGCIVEHWDAGERWPAT